jgi:hypothetical protein
MKLHDQFISQTGRQSSDWTSRDIRKCLNYVKIHATKVAVLKGDDNFLNSVRINACKKRRYQ